MGKLELITHGEAETAGLGRTIALAIAAGPGTGDLLLLSGDLGTGKTALARALIRQIAGDDEVEVPSPTYTLCHEYDLVPAIAHYDLYRLSGMDELDELGWEDQLETGAVIFEWPERCFESLPKHAVHVTLRHDEGDRRNVTIEGEGDFFSRLERSFEISEFLASTTLIEPSRKHLSADASARSYEIISDGQNRFFLMNSPAMPDGPIIRDGKPYSQIAHLAENVDAFVGIAKLLRSKGFLAPDIPFFDLDKGLLLIEHLGTGSILDEAGKPVKDRYMASVGFLAELHQHAFERKTEISENRFYEVPDYDEGAVLVEAELLIDWYMPEHAQHPLSDTQKDQFRAIWRDLHAKLRKFEHSIVLRDYHSPNIIWQEGMKGRDRIGVIDFQDAMIGPSSYDVASIAQDARVDISPELENQLVEHYIQCRNRLDKAFDEDEFRASYAIMAAQRASKILGIFIRLHKRDNKDAYLKHLPRIRDYLKRSLAHDILAGYQDWLETVIKL